MAYNCSCCDDFCMIKYVSYLSLVIFLQLKLIVKKLAVCNEDRVDSKDARCCLGWIYLDQIIICLLSVLLYLIFEFILSILAKIKRMKSKSYKNQFYSINSSENEH